MNPEDEKTKPESQGKLLAFEGGDARKPYHRPRFRSLGKVNAITLAPLSTTDEDSRKKPHG